MAYDVFISHCTKDKPYADAVCARFGMQAESAAGLRHGTFYPGSRGLKRSLTRWRIAAFSCLFLPPTPTAPNKPSKKWICAVNHNKTIIPFRLEDIKPTGSMEYFLGNLHWLDALSPHLKSTSKTW